MPVGIELPGEFGVVDRPRTVLATGCLSLPVLIAFESVPLLTPHWRAAWPRVSMSFPLWFPLGQN
jgi:hypothetical protein